MTSLTVKRKKDRAIMASALAQLLEGKGATVSVSPEGVSSYHPNAIQLGIHVRADGRHAYIGVSFDGKSGQPDIYVCTWNTEGRACLSSAMSWAGSVNPHHHGKATRVCYGFQDLSDKLKRDVELLVSGEGFSPEREADLKARYEARGWA